MQNFFAYVKANKWISLGVLVVFLFGAGVVLFQNGNGVKQTLVLEPRTLVQQISVSGRVVAVDDVDLSFVQSGRVVRVPVSVGSKVSVGTLLAALDGSEAQALVLQRKASLAAEEAALQDLSDGTRPEELAVSEASVKSAEVALIQSKLALVNAMNDAARASDGAVRVDVDQFISNPRTDPQIVFTVSSAQVEAEAEIGRQSVEGVLTAFQTLVSGASTSSDIESSLSSVKGYLGSVVIFLNAASTAVSKGIPTSSVSAATIEGYAADVASARTAVNAAVTTLTTAETAFRTAEASLLSAQKNLILKQSGATASSIAAQQARVDAARAQVLDAEAQLRKTYIIAPFGGVVAAIDIELGEIASPGVPVISLISEDALQIESFVPEINLSLLKVGDPAVVTLDAYGSSVPFGATVVSVDPAETIRDGVSTYRAIIGFTADDERVRAGMTANIVITALTKEGVLMIPVGAVKTKNGISNVSVLENGAAKERVVTTGALSSFGDIEILSGLSAGDEVILAE